jgi:hypothetical protein
MRRVYYERIRIGRGAARGWHFLVPGGKISLFKLENDISSNSAPLPWPSGSGLVGVVHCVVFLSLHTLQAITHTFPTLPFLDIRKFS